MSLENTSLNYCILKTTEKKKNTSGVMHLLHLSRHQTLHLSQETLQRLVPSKDQAGKETEFLCDCINIRRHNFIFLFLVICHTGFIANNTKKFLQVLSLKNPKKTQAQNTLWPTIK